MLSWRLWRAIFHNSLYNFPVLLQDPGRTTPRIWNFSSRKSVIMTTAPGIGAAFIFVLFPMLIPLTMTTLFVALVAFGGTLSGWIAATRISGTIFREQEKERYDLLLLTPPGVLGVHWAIVTRNLRDDRLLRWLRWLPFGAFILLAVLLFGLLIGIVTSSFVWIFSDSSMGFTALFQVSLGLLVVLILYSDYIQSVVIGVLVGILLPTYATTRAENSAYALASACFFSLQVVYYSVFGLFGMWLIGQIILPSLAEGQHLIPVIAAGGILVATFASREMAVRLLWRMAEERLYFDAQESGVQA
jgi:hypothetical protein